MATRPGHRKRNDTLQAFEFGSFPSFQLRKVDFQFRKWNSLNHVNRATSKRRYVIETIDFVQFAQSPLHGLPGHLRFLAKVLGRKVDPFTLPRTDSLFHQSQDVPPFFGIAWHHVDDRRKLAGDTNRGLVLLRFESFDRTALLQQVFADANSLSPYRRFKFVLQFL